MSTIVAGKFKDICLKMLDDVAKTRTPITIAKRGRPVATPVPCLNSAGRRKLAGAHAVTQRTQEIGVRLALGGRSRDALGLLVGQGMRLVLLGIAVGLAGSFALGHVLAEMLYRVTPTDRVTLATASVLLASVGLLACYIPARRVTRLDPVVALRHE